MLRFVAFLAASLVLASRRARANISVRPITLIISFAVAFERHRSSARYGNKLPNVGQPVVVDNRAGAALDRHRWPSPARRQTVLHSLLGRRPSRSTRVSEEHAFDTVKDCHAVVLIARAPLLVPRRKASVESAQRVVPHNGELVPASSRFDLTTPPESLFASHSHRAGATTAPLFHYPHSANVVLLHRTYAWLNFRRAAAGDGPGVPPRCSSRTSSTVPRRGLPMQTRIPGSRYGERPRLRMVFEPSPDAQRSEVWATSERLGLRPRLSAAFRHIFGGALRDRAPSPAPKRLALTSRRRKLETAVPPGPPTAGPSDSAVAMFLHPTRLLPPMTRRWSARDP